MWIALGRGGVQYLVKLGEGLNYKNCRGIKFISQRLNLCEKIVKKRLPDIAEIRENQFVFMTGGSIREPIFAQATDREVEGGTGICT